MAELVRNPCRFGCHIQIVCTHGSAVISTGIQSYSMRRGTGLFLLGGGLVQVVEPSPDFRVRMLLYPKDLMMKVLIPLILILTIWMPGRILMNGKESCCGWIWRRCCFPVRCPASAST